MTTTLLTGTTVRIKATFTAYAPVGTTGSLSDPDGNIATVTVYNSDLEELDEYSAVRESQGVFHYDWTTPDIEGHYYLEFKANFAGLPQLNRQQYKVKFRPVE